jgi:hypothetical protein
MYVFYPKEYHKSLQQTDEKKNIAEKVCWDLVTKKEMWFSSIERKVNIKFMMTQAYISLH